MRFRGHIVAAAAALLVICATGWADTTLLPLTDDAYINGNKPGLNYGAADKFRVHSYGPKHGLVRFDAASIAGQTVNSATLTLDIVGGLILPGDTFEVRPITSTWDETTVTWNTNPSVSSPVAVADTPLLGFVSVDVTTAVQQWADGSLPDAGFRIVTSDSIKMDIATKERTSGEPPALTVDYSPSIPPVATGVGTPPVVLDLSSPPVIIDESGTYILDQDWVLKADYGTNVDMIQISSFVDLDLRGFTVTLKQIGGTLIDISDGNVTIKNGALDAYSALAVRVSEGYVRMSNVEIFTGPAGTGVAFSNGWGSIENSSIGGQIAVGSLAGPVSIRFNRLDSLATTLSLNGNRSLVTDNDVYGTGGGLPVIRVSGDANVLARNTIKYGGVDNPGLVLSGNGNTVQGNTFVSVYDSNNAVVINGTQNLLKDNVVRPYAPMGSLTVPGFAFTQSGNIYGNNSVSSSTGNGFALGSTTQVDLGGNTTF